ncbi:MAG: hypothetical protein J6Y20_07285 [Lachnospiraceae bacterium]|nr:hypothetical protein [Lachnospiraceae bacterium]
MLTTKKNELVKTQCELSRVKRENDILNELVGSQRATIDAMSRRQKELEAKLDACVKDLKKLILDERGDPCELCLHYPGNTTEYCKAECERFSLSGFVWRGIKTGEEF